MFQSPNLLPTPKIGEHIADGGHAEYATLGHYPRSDSVRAGEGGPGSDDMARSDSINGQRSATRPVQGQLAAAARGPGVRAWF